MMGGKAEVSPVTLLIGFVSRLSRLSLERKSCGRVVAVDDIKLVVPCPQTTTDPLLCSQLLRRR